MKLICAPWSKKHLVLVGAGVLELRLVSWTRTRAVGRAAVEIAGDTACEAQTTSRGSVPNNETVGVTALVFGWSVAVRGCAGFPFWFRAFLGGSGVGRSDCTGGEDWLVRSVFPPGEGDCSL